MATWQTTFLNVVRVHYGRRTELKPGFQACPFRMPVLNRLFKAYLTFGVKLAIFSIFPSLPAFTVWSPCFRLNHLMSKKREKKNQTSGHAVFSLTIECCHRNTLSFIWWTQSLLWNLSFHPGSLKGHHKIPLVVNSLFLLHVLALTFKGDMVNSIEKNVMNAADYVEHAKEETKKAVKYQSKARRVSFLIIEQDHLSLLF